MNGNLWRACVLGSVGVLAGVLVGGCGGDDQAAPEPTFSSSSPRPTAGSSSPVVESSSAAPSETPEEFVRRWNDLSTAMQDTGDTSDYRKASRGCIACSRVADIVEGYYKAGGYVEGGAWHFKALSCETPVPSRSQCTGLIGYDQTLVVKSAGSAKQRLAAGQFTVLFYLSKTAASSWNMSDLKQQAT